MAIKDVKKARDKYQLSQKIRKTWVAAHNPDFQGNPVDAKMQVKTGLFGERLQAAERRGDMTALEVAVFLRDVSQDQVTGEITNTENNSQRAYVDSVYTNLANVIYGIDTKKLPDLALSIKPGKPGKEYAPFMKLAAARHAILTGISGDDLDISPYITDLRGRVKDKLIQGVLEKSASEDERIGARLAQSRVVQLGEKAKEGKDTEYFRGYVQRTLISYKEPERTNAGLAIGGFV